MSEVTLKIDSSDEYTSNYGDGSDGCRWVKLEHANNAIDNAKQEGRAQALDECVKVLHSFFTGGGVVDEEIFIQQLEQEIKQLKEQP